MRLPRRPLLIAERASWALGLVGLMWWGTHHVGMASSTRHEIERFATLRALPAPDAAPDLALWSPQRVSAWQKALEDPAPPPLAVLRIPKIRLEVAVLPGTDERTLDRAAGHIEDTPPPGAAGNSGIAGHRDGFFRGLESIAAGDALELDTLQGTQVYRIERTWVVEPADVSVLDPTPTSALTLVTCYPFYFVGAAPQRFIVRAVRVAGHAMSSRSSAVREPCFRCGSRQLAAVLWPLYVTSTSRTHATEWRVL